MKLQCSILIVTWNRDDLLQNCLRSIETVYGTSPQIVVVDNANNADTCRLCERFSNVCYVKSEQNLGFSGGNNHGLRFCKHERVILLNNDTIVKADSFTPLLGYLDEHESVGVVQGTMNLPLHDDVLDMCGGFLTPFGDVHMRFMYCRTRDVSPPTKLVFCAKGACLAFKKEVLNGIIGDCLFHEHFFLNYEETDFCHRVWLNGYEVVFVNTPPIDHLMNQSVKLINHLEFNKQNLSNVLFSWITLFEVKTLFLLLSRFSIMQMVLIVNDLRYCRFTTLRILCGAVWRIAKKLSAIRSVRIEMRERRKITDAELIEKIMIHPPISYYWSTLRGRRDFADQF